MTTHRTHIDVAPLLEPSSVAVIGASEDTTRYPGKIMANIVRFGYQGDLVAVNPKYSSVFGVPCVSSVSEAGSPIDVALIAISASNTLSALEEAAEAGARAAILYASGFAEATDEGRTRQARALDIANAAKMAVLGPNSLGLMNFRMPAILSGAAALANPSIMAGPVALITQSGGVMGSILDRGWDFGLGFRGAIATGNEAQLFASDFIRHFALDDETKVIAMFLEGIKDASLFYEASDAARSAGKRLVVLKVGRSNAAKEAAASHTGAIAGNNEAMEALFDQCGVTQVRNLEELIGVSRILVDERTRRNPRVAVSALSGGLAGLSADACQDFGVDLADLAGETLDDIGRLQAGFGHAANPLDITGQVVSEDGWGDFRTIQETLLRDPGVDLLVVAQPSSQFSDRSAKDIAAINDTAAKPIVAVWTGGSAVQEAIRALRADGVPTFNDVETCFRSIALSGLDTSLGEPLDSPARVGKITREKARKIISACGSGLVPEPVALELLKLFQIPVCNFDVATSPAQAGQIADRIGYPVVVKAIKRDLRHKSDVGGVVLDVANRSTVESSSQTIMDTVGAPEILVAQMIGEGVELLVGYRHDEQVGPVIVVGLGGVLVEVLRDSVTLRPPIDSARVLAALQRLRGYALLSGVRGGPPVNVEEVADAVVRFSELVTDNADLLSSAEINPLICDASGVTAVDVLIEKR